MTTIYQYFTDKLGAAPADDTLRQLPINSNTSGHPSGSADVRCGRSCCSSCLAFWIFTDIAVKRRTYVNIRVIQASANTVLGYTLGYRRHGSFG